MDWKPAPLPGTFAGSAARDPRGLPLPVPVPPRGGAGVKPGALGLLFVLFLGRSRPMSVRFVSFRFVLLFASPSVNQGNSTYEDERSEDV
jgi:hypothetical protein